jgi:YD repeat-containing protein
MGEYVQDQVAAGVKSPHLIVSFKDLVDDNLCRWNTGDPKDIPTIGGGVLKASSYFPNPPPYSPPMNQGPPDLCPCEANPVNPSTGNKFQIETDYAGGGFFPLRFVRVYNSSATWDASAGIGPGWTHTYHRFLQFDGDNVIAAREDGKRLRFTKNGTAYDADPTSDYRLASITTPIVGWQLVTPQDETEIYTSNGRLESIENRAGLKITLGYTNGLLTQVTDPFQRTLVIGRNDPAGLGRIMSVTTASGAITYSYSTTAARSLISVTWPTTPTPATRTYQYHATLTNFLIGILDENGAQFSNYEYETSGDLKGLLKVSEQAGGAGRVEIANSIVAGVRQVGVKRFVDAGVSADRTYSYESIVGSGALKGIQPTSGTEPLPCPSCGPPVVKRDTRGNPTLQTDWNGNCSTFTYEADRNLEATREEGRAYDALTETCTGTLLRKVTTVWHPTFHLPKDVAEPLRITNNVYDLDGKTCGAIGALCSRTIQATTDDTGSQGFGATLTGVSRTWSYSYNAAGQVTQVNGPRTGIDITNYAYFENSGAPPDCQTTLPTSSRTGCRGQLKSVTNAKGHVTSINEYNGHGQPLKITDPNGLVTLLTYDTRQRLTSRNVGGETTTYAYSAAGQLTRVTSPDSSFLDYGYDNAHRLNRIQDRKDAQGALGDRIEYVLDRAGNRKTEEVFDSQNVKVQTKSREYSEINRLTKEFGAAGQRTEYQYNGQGSVTSVKDPLDRITLSSFDPLNRLKDVTDPASGLVQYKYNGQDALVQVIDPRTLSTDYSVDGLGNLFCQKSPDTGDTYMGDSCATGANGFDAAGNVLKRTDQKAQVTTFSYDALNRALVITFGAGSKNEIRNEYGYDQGLYGLGRLTSIVEKDSAGQPTVSTGYAYDQKGRVITQTRTIAGNPNPFITSYRYDAFGRMDRVTYPSGRTVSYFFDAMGRPSQVLPVVSGVQYHRPGRRATTRPMRARSTRMGGSTPTSSARRLTTSASTRQASSPISGLRRAIRRTRPCIPTISSTASRAPRPQAAASSTPTTPPATA